MGDPRPVIADAHAAGTRVVAAGTTVEEAVRVASAGVDMVVAQGAEAGGHRSVFEAPRGGEAPLMGTLALVPQVVDAARLPVLAAGGIADGRGEYRQDGPEPLAWPLQAAAAEDIYQAARTSDDADFFPLFAGQGLRLLKRDQGAEEIVAELVTEARAVIARLGELTAAFGVAGP